MAVESDLSESMPRVALVTERLRGNRPADLARAAALLRAGGIVALPTETVYGLAGNALDEAVVGKIYAAKGRPSDNPLIVHVRGIDEVAPLVTAVPAAAQELAARFWPGPLSIVLPKSHVVPDSVTGGGGTVAVRAPDHPAFQAVLALAGVPLAAPSANLAGRPSPTTAEHVLADLDGRIDAVLDGGPCRVGVESTVVALAAESLHLGEDSVWRPSRAAEAMAPTAGRRPSARVLRPGGVSLQQLSDVLGAVALDAAVSGNLAADVVPGAPGMKYRHYAPPAPMTILTGPLEAAASYVRTFVAERPGETVAVLCPTEEAGAFRAAQTPLESSAAPRVVTYGANAEPDALARGLFAALHNLGDARIDQIFTRLPMTADGINLATRNRLQKAAGFSQIALGDNE